MSLNNLNAQLFSVEEAGRLLGGISPWTLRKHIARGNVTVTRLGRRIFLDEAEMSRIAREGLPSLRSGGPSGNDGKTIERPARLDQEELARFIASGKATGGSVSSQIQSGHQEKNNEGRSL
jgi:hypothetical protein